MDSTASRKRSREEVSSDDEEDGPRKQSATSPADPEPSDEDNDPTQCTEETGTEATTPASLDEAAAATPAVAAALATPPTGATAPEAQAAVDHVTQIVTSLLLTLQDAEAKLPHDHPFRAICQLAAALQQPTSHHG
ncbi:hypothetical protein HPB52_015427 [Rhipicephalus sanguineus]|uniref:Uncharacterized protein n=1 Tax=Rhipicephalus sanguineus TaxID=34632 RepID=A0A9D4Q0L0_RHISA|nr:hypothetical protein HPB52_015427 [Rhipicephalus sanguineus]